VFKNPQSPVEMLTPKVTEISTLYLQVKAGGDIAAITGLVKHVLAAEDAKWRETQQHVLDVDFIAQHTAGFEAMKAHAEAISWEEIERESGLSREDLGEAAQIYIDAPRSIAMFGMGLTQHVHGSQNLAALTNLWLLKGNVGRDGTGISPVRGHSNVQGQRTVGISEKPELVPLDKLAEQFGFEPPRQEGLNTVKACHKILSGEVQAFVGLGGNFIRAIPEREKMEEAWTKLRLTVQIATRLNRSHLVHGKIAYLLPCLGRSEDDVQATGSQAVTMEDSLSCIHGSLGKNRPASEDLMSEIAIVAGIAKATLPANPKVRWDEWTGDYAQIRDCIEATYPDQFHDFNSRVFTPGGFYRGNPARERIWKTASGKAQFSVPTAMRSIGFEDAPGRYRLMTLRSNDQFNTTIYGYSDRLRGIEGTRDIVLMHPDDIAEAGLTQGQVIGLVGDSGDGVHRQVDGLTLTPFLLPRGCIGAYYPEMNPLIPLWYHDGESKTPASKGVPVRIVQ
jgi:molybdopterin-dependent oxidoreductase alpha subunit